jgi:hypothetical protein
MSYEHQLLAQKTKTWKTEKIQHLARNETNENMEKKGGGALMGRISEMC